MPVRRAPDHTASSAGAFGAPKRWLKKAGIRSWRDIRDMESGDILPQVLRRGPAANSGSKPRRRMLKPR